MAIPSPQAWGTVGVRLAADAASAPGAPASVAQGDILWLRIEDGGTDAGTGLPTVSGGTETWNQHPASPVFGSGASRLSLYWARASQAAPTMPNIGGGVNHTHARVARTTGGKSSGNPWNGTEYASGNDAAVDPTIPGFVTGGADRLVLDFVTSGFNGTSSTRFSAWANASLASPSITEWDDDVNTIGTGGGGGSSYGGMASAGTVASTTVTEAFAGHSYIKVAMAAAADPAVINVDTAGAITLAGQSSPLSTVLGIVSGALTLAGQIVGLTEQVTPTAGQIILAGATDITLVAGGSPPAVETGWDEVGEFWTDSASSAGRYPAAADSVSETGLRLFSLAAAAGTTTITVTTPGAITWAGQGVGLTTSIAPTPGALTLTGSSTTLASSIAPTAGAITWAGSSVGLKTTITPSPGAITLAGATDIALVTTGPVVVSVTTPGAITLAGSSVGLNTSIGAIAGAVTLMGQNVGLTTAAGVSAGAITLAGQSVGLKTSQAITAGAITWAGSSVGLKLTVTPTQGQITWAGATDIGAGAGPVTITVTTPGQITLAGQALGLRTSLGITAGNTTWAGQALGLRFGVTVTPGAIQWAGQSVTLVHTITPVTGGFTLAGSASGLGLQVGVTAGQMVWAGQDVFLFDSGAVVVKPPTWADPIGTGARAVSQTNPDGANPQGTGADGLPTSGPNRVLVSSGSTDAREV